MEEMTFFIAGTPVPKGRPIASTFSGRVTMRTPQKTRSYEHAIGWTFRQKYADHIPVEHPVSVEITAFYLPPKAMPKKMRALLPLPKTTKPDVDNVMKAVLDGLNGIAYRDDSQVYEVTARKLYSIDTEGVLVILKFM
jgi:Holliday junction resolvase RusA-like endonuclease